MKGSAAATLMTLVLGCSSPEPAASRPPTLLEQPQAALPTKLSQVGLYPQLPALQLAPRALGYEPTYPLWSDGGQKQRALVLPEGEQLDDSDPAAYAFPVGTLIFKTFSFRTPESPTSERPVETRLLRLNDDGWELAAYAWDDAGTEAELLDLKRSQTREVLSDDDEVVEHAIPSKLECRQCHESASSEVLGINALQQRELSGHGPLTTRVLGYLVGNCVHCHNGSNGAASSFDLRPDVALQNLVDRPTESSATADGIRVVPGKPEESVMFLGVKGSSDLEVKDMPPLGVALRDASAITLLESWITALADEQDP